MFMNYFFSAFSLQCYRVLGIAPTKMVSEKSYNAHVHVQCMFLWVSLHISQVVHQVRGYPGFCRMKWLEWVFLLPLEWDSSPSHHRVYPSIKFACTHLFTWVEEVQLWELRTQHTVPGQGSNLTQRQARQPWRHSTSNKCEYNNINYM